MNVYSHKGLDYLHVFTKISTVPRPPHPPISAFVECVDSTERSSASKNPNVSSGTWPAGDRPVPQTESSLEANAIRPGSLLNSPVSREEIAARAFAASLVSVGDQCSDSSPHCPSRNKIYKQNCSQWLVSEALIDNVAKA